MVELDGENVRVCSMSGDGCERIIVVIIVLVVVKIVGTSIAFF